MLRRYIYIILAAVQCALLSGCAVHQWPEQKSPEVTIPLRLEYEPDLYIWEHLYDPLLGIVEAEHPSPDPFPDYPGASSKYTNIVPAGVVAVYVKVFPADDPRRCIMEQTFINEINGGYDTDLKLALPDEATYDIVVWSDLLTGAAAEPFYDATDFNRVHIIADNYAGNTDYRDAYRGRIRVDASATEGSHVVRMRRPMGKFELVTTDLSEFLDRETTRLNLPTRAKAEDYRVVISFPMYYPNSYSAMEDRLENAAMGVAFETRMTVTGVSEASLGFEYVMLNDIADSGVQTRVDVYDMSGNHVAGSAMFTVPMRRDYHTLLRGAFLSTEGSGGVGIDPGFNGDHNITWQ